MTRSAHISILLTSAAVKAYMLAGILWSRGYEVYKKASMAFSASDVKEVEVVL